MRWICEGYAKGNRANVGDYDAARKVVPFTCAAEADTEEADHASSLVSRAPQNPARITSSNKNTGKICSTQNFLREVSESCRTRNSAILTAGMALTSTDSSPCTRGWDSKIWARKKMTLQEVTFRMTWEVWSCFVDGKSCNV